MLTSQRKSYTSRSSPQPKSFLPEGKYLLRLLLTISKHTALQCSQTVITRPYDLVCIVYEGVVNEHTPFKSQRWFCNQMKPGSTAEAVNAKQLSGNRHAACAHLKTGWITASCNKCKQTHSSQRKEVIYLPSQLSEITVTFTLKSMWNFRQAAFC